MSRWFVDRTAREGIPAVSLKGLLPEAQFPGLPDLEVSGCTADARRLEPGEVFVALPGRGDLDEQIGLALTRGAAAVVVETPSPEAGSLQVIVPDARRAYGQIAHALAGDPCRRIRITAVTGAIGQTATAVALRAILEAAGERVGLITAAGWSDGLTTLPAPATVPDAAALAAMLGRMVERGCTSAVIVIAPEALEQHRAEGLILTEVIVTAVRPAGVAAPDAVVARRAMARLVHRVRPGGAVVVNADDAWAAVLGGVHLGARSLGISLDDPSATLSARVDHRDLAGTRLRLQSPERQWTVHLKRPGDAAVRAALLAAAVAWDRGLTAEAIVAGLEAAATVPGQLEPIADLPEGLTGRFDRARTGAELAEALATLREAGAGRIVCIASAGAHPEDLPALAEAAEAGADQVIATADEALDELAVTAALDDLLAGFRRPGRVRIEPDRRAALAAAIELARPGDVLLFAGQSTPPPRPAAARPRAGLRFDGPHPGPRPPRRD